MLHKAPALCTGLSTTCFGPDPELPLHFAGSQGQAIAVCEHICPCSWGTTTLQGGEDVECGARAAMKLILVLFPRYERVS